MIAIINYNTGNLRSVLNAMKRVQAHCLVTSDPGVIRAASHVILPGVGEAAYAMDQLRQLGLDQVIPTLTQPVLGICIGMQLMCAHSQEGDAACLDIFPTEVRKLDADLSAGIKIPHMGWDKVHHDGNALFEGIPQDAYFYYVHSYAADVCADTIATSECGRQYSAVLNKGNFYGVQFHPEKSSAVGERLLRNFLQIK